jgi:hypothetical protein
MRGAIASVEIFAQRGEEPVQRLSLVVGEPTAPANPGASADTGQAEWTCRVALANRHRAEQVYGLDSVAALSEALGRARKWILALQAEGFTLCRDRQMSRPYVLD